MTQLRKTFTRALAAVALSAASLAVAIPQSAQAAGGGHILAHVMPTDHIFNSVSQVFISKLDELSGGTMKIEYHPGGDLGDWATITEQVMQGAVPMTMAWSNSELDPRLDIANLGYVADDWASARQVYGPGSKMDKLFSEIYGGLNVELLGTLPTDFTGYVVRKGVDVPVNVPQDAKGFKIRVPNYPMAIDRYSALGFSVVPMAFSEVHTALQTGAIDGRAFSPPYEVLLFRDVLRAYVYTRESFEPTFWIASQSWLSGLSDQQRQWVHQAANHATQWAWDNAEAFSQGWLDKIRAAGIEVLEQDPAQAAVYKKTVMDVEWPIMEKLLGKQVMDELKVTAGL
ncbi:TRAP transporter substrate-binding protein DctP [Marinobacterium arenosum]|uniref:TRAP transporter substrate-binding protein DctP n=1 Tax=Marinobacterium arenosum TaxID=2862496 RepID=UPI001C98CD70|nr:TRAP transporter substrate-binding protein DctP [Marinobacterium arenosum]MBY4678367.1 TRAP transporter substrate-binding protein DctP [Marinobacterium arenosum]